MLLRIKRWFAQTESIEQIRQPENGEFDPASSNFRPTEADPQLQQWKEAARYHLDRQFEAMEGLDRRLGQTLTLASTVLPISFALLNLNDGHLPSTTKGFFIAALVFYSVLLIMNFEFSRRSSIFKTEVDPSTVAKLVSAGATASAIEGWIADQYTRATVQNDAILLRKSRFAFVLNYCFFLEVICIIAAAFSAANIDAEWLTALF